ncbi:unnamed protein product [Acanthoscelides obtectus]|uniref:Lipase domain-containing protein n=3 Tax=Acanthoscelides obtectus TaxID=200917 RepID=A0A9P0KX83_ACAOB|nr:unnamed protein product [Acanthoscelides obtectus]CAK1620510.1 Pancreatic triacylglycerol lipase [Acanthoscelides obtectus]
MLVARCAVLLVLWALAGTGSAQILRNPRFRRFPMKAALGLKERLKQRFEKYRERNTQQICYETVGCFNLPHKNSPLQKVPEDPRVVETKFYLFTRNIDFHKPEVLYYDDNGTSLQESSFNFSNPLKVVVHGYTSRWNEKGSIIIANSYLKLYDCNVILMDWHRGARGPQYAVAAANTELVGRQLGILLNKMVEKGLDVRKIHLIGFSLGAHVAGTASESLKNRGLLLGRITGLDPASPLFRGNYLREQYKKLDRSDAKFVDVIHTDGSPSVTDGFGLWDPIGHVDFYPNGGQEQPGCHDVRDSIIVTQFERGLSREIVCSHIRAFLLFKESLVNMVAKQKENKTACDFTAYNCPGGIESFENGHCFPQLERNESSSLDPSYRFDIGRFGEDVKGEGVMYFSTKDSSQFCGTQLQASVQLSPKTGPVNGVLQLQLFYSNHSVIFQIQCKFLDISNSFTHLNGLATAEYNSMDKHVETIQARLNYLDFTNIEMPSNHSISLYTSVLFIDKVVVRDMYGNSWQYCEKGTVLEDKTGQRYGLLNITLKKASC